jgi:uncharacterized protein with ParB-like and HNH nuclease domain
MAKNSIISHTLNNIFHLMENGSLAVPVFQRGYVWDKEAVKKLFESINSGFPIGILIAIEHEPEHFKSASKKSTLFPEVSLENFVSPKKLWIVDGSQRLAALYNVFFGKNDSFTLLYDLERKEFFFPEEVKDKTILLNMSSLFKVKEFMQLQATIARLDDSEALLEELYAIHNRFTDYQVPIQIIADVIDEDIVKIFTTLNTSGITLTKDELEQARKYKNSKQ